MPKIFFSRRGSKILFSTLVNRFIANVFQEGCGKADKVYWFTQRFRCLMGCAQSREKSIFGDCERPILSTCWLSNACSNETEKTTQTTWPQTSSHKSLKICGIFVINLTVVECTHLGEINFVSNVHWKIWQSFKFLQLIRSFYFVGTSKV